MDALDNKDRRPKRGGWAPGNYLNVCNDCDEEFVGDKLAWVCAKCAYTTLKWLHSKCQHEDTGCETIIPLWRKCPRRYFRYETRWNPFPWAPFGGDK